MVCGSDPVAVGVVVGDGEAVALREGVLLSEADGVGAAVIEGEDDREVDPVMEADRPDEMEDVAVGGEVPVVVPV